MEIIGQQLLQPENGWRRYDDIDSAIEYIGAFTHENVSGAYNSTTSFNPKISTAGEIHFYFKGTSLRILSPNHPTIRTSQFSVYIDDVEFNGRCNFGNDYTVLSFEKVDLEDKIHKVVIKNFTLNTGITSTYASFGLDAVDINDNGELRLPYKKLITKNPTTNKHYSLLDNTLIHLPDNTTESIIENGIEQGKYIQLDVPFTKIIYVNNTPSPNGKLFTQTINRVNSLNIKEAKDDNFKPLYTWYETKMTSHNTPTPLIASASSEFDTTYTAWKAFDGDSTTDNYWCTTASGKSNCWLTLDFNSPQTFNAVNIFPMTTKKITYHPKEFKIQGSNDNTDFTDLVAVNETWDTETIKTVDFKNTQKYRYYRIFIIENSGATWTGIREMRFGYKREVK
ncbi:discoidin domain-containing protein [Lysinibacillus sphaericus]|uniref:Cell adhesion domain-containing protein n=1 Tax=Lysinibacillus sphaericus OT4b.31 TaxID=1285586 RepID=R7ZFC5_LYSSH|nr:discoidin domain-containing protein [Lysinibacillus sphaericus]EON72827.1 cell adhesion domain-containing protein [Lysinibacillus sphaericus OT4b.31]